MTFFLSVLKAEEAIFLLAQEPLIIEQVLMFLFYFKM